MALLHRHFILSFLIIMISCVACYNTLQEDPLSLYVEDLPYIIDDNGGTFKDLIKQSTNDIVDSSGTSPSQKTIYVNDYGAKGDGRTDDTEAFKKAWQATCSSEEAIVLLAQNNYLLKPIRFSGPCKSNIVFQISGTLEASDNPSDYSNDPTHWLIFDSIDKLTVQGGGTINGNGNIWWQNSCKKNKKLPCKDAPTALTFYKCKNLIVEELSIKDGQQIQVSFQESKNVKASTLTVTAPEDSPNTDGIHVTNTQNIQISSCLIATGDDCISIVSGSKNLQATDITCGPGHGISIGSLGAGKSKEFVSGIVVNGAKLSGTTNGVRIKTWQGGSGSASNIKFQNIEMDNVTNPIIIDQSYCDQKEPCKEQQSAVQVRNVLYQNIKGTSASDMAIEFDCAEYYPCEGIVLQNIDLQSEDGEVANASCKNVKLSYRGNVNPSCPKKERKEIALDTA
ncbi:PREDICTED: polygalacturonase-like [Lupinus angustifolius]|nr:PREDICTED: polygalacturonase-like [Lupinus angustifolius]